MSDFEKAAQRLRDANLKGHRVTHDGQSELEPDASEKSLTNLQGILRKKLHEPLDVVLPKDFSAVNSEPTDTSLQFSALETERLTAAPLAAKPVTNGQNAYSSLLNSPAEIESGRKPAALDEFITLDVPKTVAADELSVPSRPLVLSFSSMASKGFITPGTSKGRLTEEYRRIKRPLLKRMNGASPDTHQNVVMVTSSVQGEGKTYTAINLAVSLAQEKNHSVLLIDADVVKGTAGRELGVSTDDPGLLDLLSHTCTHPSQVILNTNIPGLEFIPAGKTDEHANELLTSERMRSCINLLARESEERIIVLDCPPILQTNEANVLTEYAGQIVFVVAGQQTSQSLVQEALQHLDKDKYVGMLLNKSTRAGADYGYGYGYGYQ